MELPGAAAPVAGGTAAASPETQKLARAAQDFEALMISELLRAAKMDGSAGWLDSEDSASDAAFGLAQEQFSRALAGGMGIARMVLDSMGPTRSSSATPSPGTNRP